MTAKIGILNPSLFSTRSRTHSHSQLRQLRYSSTISASAAVSNRTLARPILSLKPHQPTCWMQLPSSSPSPSSPSSSVAAMWRDIQGAGDWEHLLQPLHPLLRRETIRYAELVLACYRAFDLDPSSKRYLNCKYGKSTLLRDVGMTTAGYEITKYIYATPGITIPTQTEPCTSHWIGYVAVSNDKTTARLGRRDILVSFRGTVTNTEWIANFMSSLTPARLDPINPRPDVMVESGFLSIYTSDDTKSCFGTGSCRQQLLVEISKLIRKYRDEEDISITLAGHSMGSSLALLLGYDIAELGLNRAGEIPITVYSFAGPRVGNSGFKSRCEELGVKVLRVANVNDPVTKMPGLFFNEGFKVWAGKMELPWMDSTCYAHVGVELALDFFDIQNPACVHDLDAYIDRLKCASMQKVKEEEEDLFTKLMEFLSSHLFDSCPFWQEGESHGGEMVQ